LFLFLLVPQISAAPVEVVSPESVGMSTERLVALKQRLQQAPDERMTGGIQVLISRLGEVVMFENLGYANVEERQDWGKQPVFEGDLSTNHLRPPGGFSGGGQLVSTADDYRRFSQRLLNGGEFEGVRYLSPKTIDMMRDNRLPAGHSVTRDGNVGFGLDVAVFVDASGVPYPASDGEYFRSALATTVFWIDPKEELIVVMLTQYLPFNGPYFRDLMHRMVRAAIIE
jgi:CubicO group peptidase (beta-lactamase class C family)